MTEPTSADPVLREHRDGVVVLTLNRPEKRNAITSTMFTSLTAALLDAAADDSVRVVVLTGAGESFTAGIDLGALAERRDIGVPPSNRFLHTLAEFAKPVIASVRGHAVGVGFTLTLLCDLVYAADTTQFRAPFLDMGIVPEAGSSSLLPARVGHVLAAEIFYFGETLTAARALTLGLVNEVLPASAVLDRSLQRADQISRLDPIAVQQTKALMGTGATARQQMTIEEPRFEDLLARRLRQTTKDRGAT
jgi:enoyl-CoA hydratase/carnithine racemase